MFFQLARVLIVMMDWVFMKFRTKLQIPKISKVHTWAFSVFSYRYSSALWAWPYDYLTQYSYYKNSWFLAHRRYVDGPFIIWVCRSRHHSLHESTLHFNLSSLSLLLTWKVWCSMLLNGTWQNRPYDSYCWHGAFGGTNVNIQWIPWETRS